MSKIYLSTHEMFLKRESLTWKSYRPATWNTHPSGDPSPEDFTQYIPGHIMYSPLLDDASFTVLASDLFAQSLLCQLDQRNTATVCDGNGTNCRFSTDKTALNPWPPSPPNAIYGRTSGACLFNLPIVFDNSMNLPTVYSQPGPTNFHFPDNQGTLSGVASTNEECPTGGLWQDWCYSLTDYGVPGCSGRSTGVCRNQWS